MADVLVLNGPNLNLLGMREPGIYGSVTLENIAKVLAAQAKQHELTLETFQSNWEGALIDRIHKALKEKTRFIIINPAALTHTSVGLRDALLAVNLPFIEVHLSNIYARESFRHHSYLSDKAQGVISGLGAQGYEFALMAAIEHLRPKTPDINPQRATQH